MIPALPAISNELGAAEENQRQLVVIAYMMGIGAAQLFWGPLADRFGRKPVLAAGLALYAFFALLCGLTGSFTLLVAARALQGASAAAGRVLIVTMVRDMFEGAAMARIMSLVFMVFMVVPVVAPSVGQLILLFAPWRAIFIILAVYALILLIWSWLRLPETLKPEYQRTLAMRDIAAVARATLTERQSLGYTLALTAMFGTTAAYVATIQQIVFDAFGAGDLIGLVFAGVAAPMALAAWTNSRVVGRFGVRRVGHTGIAAFLLVTTVHAGLAQAGLVGLPLFVVMQSLTMMCFAFTSANLATLAMEHMALMAGTASSVQGVIGTIGGALIGFGIGQSFDGTVLPFLWGVALCAATATVLVVLTEPKRLLAGKE